MSEVLLQIPMILIDTGLQVSNNLSNISANIKFFYNSNDVLGDEDKYKPMFLNGVTWTAVSNGFVDIYNDFFTVSNVINIDVQWTLREPITTYYSYQSGDWKNSTTWTTDPSGSVWEGGGVPSTYDRVVILNGRTVTINEDSKVLTHCSLTGRRVGYRLLQDIT